MKKLPHKKYNFKIGHIIFPLFGIGMFLSFASFILTIIYKIRSGHGLDYYFTGYGVQMNYIGVLISLIVIPFTLLVVWGVVIILNKKEIWEIEKYKKSRLLKKKMKK